MQSVIFWVVIAAILVHAFLRFGFKALNWAYARANRNTVPDNLKADVSLEQHQRSADYNQEHLYLGVIEQIVDLVVRLLILVYGVFPWAYSLALDGWGAFNFWGQSLAIFIIGTVMGVLFWPFDLFSTFKIEEKYGFNRTTAVTWVNDQFKGIVLGMILSVPITAALLWMAGTLEYWWVWAWVVVSAYRLFVSWIYPNWISPLFNKFSALEDGPLRERLHALADKAGMTFEKIFVMDASKRTAHANAYFTGFGSSRRVVLYDTLINQLSEDEVAAVLAHEIGHQKKKHVFWRMIFGRALDLLNFFILSLLVGWGDFLRAFDFGAGMGLGGILLLLSLVGGAFTWWMTPIFSAWYRKQEYEADAIAAELVGDPMPLATSLRKMTKESLHSIEPHPITRDFYASHPSLKQREAALGIACEPKTDAS